MMQKLNPFLLSKGHGEVKNIGTDHIANLFDVLHAYIIHYIHSALFF